MILSPIFLRAGGEEDRREENYDDHGHNEERRINVHGASPQSKEYQVSKPKLSHFRGSPQNPVKPSRRTFFANN
jgi:hypothetical protein